MCVGHMYFFGGLYFSHVFKGALIYPGCQSCLYFIYSWFPLFTVHARSATKSCPSVCDPMDYSLPGSSVHGFPRQEYYRGLPLPSPGDVPNPGIKPAFPAWQADSLPLSHEERKSESCSIVSNSLQPHGLYSPWNSPGQNSGVGGRSLLQRIFPTHELNPGLWHCGRILYQLSHQGSPLFTVILFY